MVVVKQSAEQMPDLGVMEGWSWPLILSHSCGRFTVTNWEAYAWSFLGNLAYGEGQCYSFVYSLCGSSWVDIFDSIQQRALISGV